MHKIVSISFYWFFFSISFTRDNLLPVTSVGLFLHLLVTYGVTNKPFSLVSKGNFQNMNIKVWKLDAKQGYVGGTEQ